MIEGNISFMSDEGCFSGFKEMVIGESLHAESEINDGVGLEVGVCLRGSGSDTKMVGEEESDFGVCNKPKLIKTQIGSDDDETIASLLKMKRRNPKKVKSMMDGSRNPRKVEKVEIRADQEMVTKKEDLGGLDDTLASVLKKLKGPKMSRNGGSGLDAATDEHLFLDNELKRTSADRGGGKRSRSSEVVKNTGVGDPNESSAIHKSRRNSTQKRKKEGGITAGESITQSSDETLDNLLSEFVRKAQSGSGKKDPGSSNQTRGSTVSADRLYESFDGASEEASAVIQDTRSASKVIPKSEIGLKLVNFETKMDPILAQKEKTEAGKIDQRLSGASNWIEEAEVSTQVNELANFNEIVDSKNWLNSTSLGVEIHPIPVQNLALIEEVKEEVDRSTYGICEGTRGSNPDPHSSFRSDCTAKLQENSAAQIAKDLGSQTNFAVDCPIYYDGVNKPSDGVSKSLLFQETGETQWVKNRLKQCSKAEEVKISVNDDGRKNKLVPMISGNVFVSASGEVSRKLDSVYRDASNVMDTITEGAKPYDALDHSRVEEPEIYTSNAAHRDSFNNDQLNQLHEENCIGGTLSSLRLGNEAERTIRYDELVQPLGEVLQDYLACTDRMSSRASLPLKMEATPKLEYRFDQCSSKEEKLNNFDASNQTTVTASELQHMGESSILNDLLHQVSLDSDAVKLSAFHTPIVDKEEPTSTGRIPNHFADELLSPSAVTPIEELHSASPQNRTSEASKATSVSSQDTVFNKEVKVIRSHSMILDLKESDPLEMQKNLRKIKKRRHQDMAYEGDNDWEFLMHEQGIFESNRVIDGGLPSRTKEKSSYLSYTGLEADDGGAAAVTAGLKAKAVGPFEKIRFKEVLKRRGGLQEYLECRNLILGLWRKDMSRILCLSDCGIEDAPTEEELPRASLVREIYEFLDQNGYINVGVASKNLKADFHVKENTTKESYGPQVADSRDGATFILGQVKSLENLTEGKNSILFNDANPASEISTLIEAEEHTLHKEQEIDGFDAKLPDITANLDDLSIYPSRKVFVQSNIFDHADGNETSQCVMRVQKRIIIIGAGPAGLTAARHLQRQGFSVTVLEARNRLGGRVFTDRSSLSVPVDLGASIITGVEADVATERRPDPSSLVCAQLGIELTVLNSECPLYDSVTGQKVPADLDEALEAEYNSLLDDMVLLVAQKGEHAMKMSLEDGLEYALKKRRAIRSKPEPEEFDFDNLVNASFDKKIPIRISSKEQNLSPLERRVMDWHFANLEYGCAASLKAVSLPYWNQDDIYGGFGGAHCMIKGGYSTVVESLGNGLPIHLNHQVTEVAYSTRDSGETGIKISTSGGTEFVGDAVLITVPLGCLKADTIKFSPSLPEWKRSSIKQLGFGVLNKVALEFPQVFWDDSIDYFGATSEESDRRGQCFMFWNVKKTVGAPVLIALIVGKAALDGESMSSSDHVNHALKVLRKLFGEVNVPNPIASVVTNWGSDPFSRGAYSYVAVEASGEDYDILGRPVDNCLFFAGEATCKEHPDTVGGAMMSGLREAVRIMHILNTGNDCTAEVEALEAAQRHSDYERNEVRDILKRLEAVELSSVLCKSSLDGNLLLTKEALLQDMFCNVRTTAGRLHLAKELLHLPVSDLKSFAGTKEGLATLNSWILDSMGKDGTQLLRHCVRLLVLVSTNLLAVRLSGIGRTVKEKVCVHTSRDIRAVASQLVSMWIAVFRREKATNGRLKLLRQKFASDSSKTKSSKDLTSGKLLRAPSHRGNVPAKLETVPDSKSEANSVRSNVDDGAVLMSEEESAALAIAEAARASALAAAEAYASREAECGTFRELPKIPSFHKFARREQYAQMDESDLRRRFSGGVLGRQDCISEIDSRNCKVRDWSVDFSAACPSLENSRMSGDNYTSHNHSNEGAYQLNLREHSGESAATVTDSRLAKAWVNSDGSGGVKDSFDIDRWQTQAEAFGSDFYHPTNHIRDEEDSNTTSNMLTTKFERHIEESTVSKPKEKKALVLNQPRGTEHVKKAVVDYVASLLMPLYKARKIDKEGYKSIMKKSATKVMEQTTDAEKTMTATEFLDFKRKNKIRAFVDKLIEKHMAMTPVSSKP